MGGKGTLSCLLCAGMLPKEEEEVVEQHMKDHHRVFTNMTLVVASSKLEETQLAGVEASRLLVTEQTVNDCSSWGSCSSRGAPRTGRSTAGRRRGALCDTRSQYS